MKHSFIVHTQSICSNVTILFHHYFPRNLLTLFTEISSPNQCFKKSENCRLFSVKRFSYPKLLILSAFWNNEFKVMEHVGVWKKKTRAVPSPSILDFTTWVVLILFQEGPLHRYLIFYTSLRAFWTFYPNIQNSRCFCKETPSTTGWNLDIFTRTILELAKLFFCRQLAHFQQAHAVWNARI